MRTRREFLESGAVATACMVLPGVPMPKAEKVRLVIESAVIEGLGRFKIARVVGKPQVVAEHAMFCFDGLCSSVSDKDKRSLVCNHKSPIATMAFGRNRQEAVQYALEKSKDTIQVEPDGTEFLHWTGESEELAKFLDGCSVGKVKPGSVLLKYNGSVEIAYEPSL